MFVWLNPETVRNILATSATLTTVLQFLTGFLICYSYLKKKSTGETSSLPFTSGLLSCSLWLRYGVLINESAVILVNSIGVFLFSIYCISYYIFTVNKRRVTHQLILVLLMIAFSIAYSKFEPDDVQASKLKGLLCCSVGVFFFASPLIKLKYVITTRNTECLPRPIIIASFFVTLQWFIYGYLINDSYPKFPRLHTVNYSTNSFCDLSTEERTEV
ncbi:CLUMA_CG018869, isoform A [Clunio marinus]|uniref:Sugar transporter SWEET1 n=1 Tax=Clunio marinus TaxID=568069 RepID=A0A1J1J1M3_9DIPT|nr:CLUMA_CG018869, isoform A [Clunio marinus]